MGSGSYRKGFRDENTLTTTTNSSRSRGMHMHTIRRRSLARDVDLDRANPISLADQPVITYANANAHIHEGVRTYSLRA
jgi:hypothetical protein